MISIVQAEQVHDVLISRFGGSPGIRDNNALASALVRPFQTFDGTELYPSTLQKAAALFESLISNHPFIDGNKRIGYVLMRLYLLENGYDIEASQQDKYDFVITVASGHKTFDGVVDWLQKHTRKKYDS